MVAKAGQTSRVGWSALLLLAQLLAFGILPSLHLASVHRSDAAARIGVAASQVMAATADLPPGPAAATDKEPVRQGSRGSEPGSHDHSTCQFCRIADSRYTPATAVALAVVTLTAARDEVCAATSWRGARTLHPTHGPRPPPLS
jgi:hypothetical protein